MEHDLKKIMSPSPEFTQKTKGRFLAAFDARYGTRPASRTSHGMAAWAKALVVAGALAAVMVSISAYADTANVSADNPLYPFKRLSENVRLALTPQGEQAQVEASLAVRRANEIEDLSTEKPSSVLIAKLSLDLQSDVSSSLGGIASGETNAVTPATSPKTPVASTICGQISSIQSDLSGNATLINRFQSHCGESATASDTGQASASTTTVTHEAPRITVPLRPWL